MAWTEGNLVRPLIHGAAYFAELHHRVSQMRDGDLLMFTDWRGDPDERLTETPDTGIGKVLADAAWTFAAWYGAPTGIAWTSPPQRTGTWATRSTPQAASASWTCGCAAGACTTRSSSSCATTSGPSSISPSSAASTCVTAAATTRPTGAICNHSRWPLSTGHGPRATTALARRTARQHRTGRRRRRDRLP